ncbi:MAG: hypothetical protein ACFHU9_04640 [Fluviicola sp.]
MKNLLLLLLINVSTTTIAQEDWHDAYVEASYDDVLAFVEQLMPNDTNECPVVCMNFVGLFDQKFKVPFTYKAEIIDGDTNRLNYINRWTSTYWPGGQFDDTFMQEVKVSHKGKDMYFFVQEPTRPFYSKELRKNDLLYLYLMFVGTLKIGDNEQYIFVANDFEKIE